MVKDRERGKRWERGKRREEVEAPSEDRVRRSRGARGMMNIKAGQAVRVDSTLSARGAHGPRRSSDQYFLCEKNGRGGRVGGGG